MVTAPILHNKQPSSPSVLAPAALLREARREKGLLALEVPRVSVLDPDGGIVRRLRATGRANPFMAWPCYHTELDALVLG
jgi:hypothetical protein